MARRHDLEVVVTTREEMERGLRQAEERIKRFSSSVENALSAVAWGALTQQIVNLGQQAINIFTQQQRAMSGLSFMARAYGQDLGAVRQVAQELTADGILPLNSAAAALRDLLGELPLDQAAELMRIFMDRAAVGRAETISFAQAVENLAQAFKTESSELGNMSGMTENWSQIIEIGAQKLGKKVDELTRAERAQAKYLGVLELSKPYIGAAASMTEDLAGKQARLETTVQRTAAAFGEALSPAAEDFTAVATEAADAVGRWVKANEDAARGMILIGGGAATALAGVGALAGAFRVLVGVLGGGWIGLAVAGLAALAGAIGGAVANARAAAIEQEREAEAVIKLSGEYEKLSAKLQDTKVSAEEKERAQQELRRVIQEIGDLMPELVSKWDAEGKAIELNTQKLRENTQELLRNKAARQNLDVEEARRAFMRAQGVLESIENEIDEALANQRRIHEENLARGVITKEEFDELVAADERMFAEAYAERLKHARDAVARARAEYTRALAVQSAGSTEDPRDYLDPNASDLSAFRRAGAGGGTVTATAFSSSDGSRSSAMDDPVRQALRVLEHRLTMGYITPHEYIAGLEEIKRAYAVTAEQLMDIDERIKRTRDQMTEEEKRNAEAARKAKLDEALRLLDFQIRMGWATTQDEIARLEEILKTFELTEEERMSLLERRKAAQDRLAEETKRREEEQAREAERTEEDRVRHAIATINHRVRMGELSRQEEITALEEHLQQEKDYYDRHVDQRWAIEERIYSLREAARQEDLRREEEAARKAAQARIDAERQLASAVSNLRALIRRQQDQELASMERVHRAQEEAQQRVIDGLRAELEALERRNREEDRALKLAELRRQLQQAEEAGPLEEFITATGERIWRNRQAEELREQIAEEERQQERERERERLQELIEREQERLNAMRQNHQQAMQERRQFWADLLALDDEELAELVSHTETSLGPDGWYGTMEHWLSQAAKLATDKVNSITSDLARMVDAVREAQRALESLTASGSIDVPEPASIPSTSAPAGMSVGEIRVEVTVPGSSNPAATAQAVAQAVPPAIQDGFDLAQARVGARWGLRIV